MSNIEDPWDAFGGDESDDYESGGEDGFGIKGDTRSCFVALFLAQQYLKRKAKPSKVRVHILELIIAADKNEPRDLVTWKTALAAKGFIISNSRSSADDILTENQTLFDTIVVLPSSIVDLSGEVRKQLSEKLKRWVVPGGSLVLSQASVVEVDESWDNNVWQTKSLETIPTDTNESMFLLHKWVCPIQCDPTNCPWLPHNNPHRLLQERERLKLACVASTAIEQETRLLSGTSIDQAVHHLSHYGYCIIPKLLDPITCQTWGNAILSDLHQAADILLERDAVNLFDPLQSKSDPATYRELSMREDLRMDLRHGPSLDHIRGGPEGCRPWTVKAADSLFEKWGDDEQPLHHHHRFFRGNAQLLEIVRRVMNPKDETLARGNFGRYNFSGSGPDGSFQDLRVGPVGGIINLPGSADQAIHADTPHLFEHMDALPAHYINAFTPGCRSHPKVGQTAFVHASHRLQFCAQNIATTTANATATNSGRTEDGWKSHVVRPSLDLGDVLLFDCRVLHFGMANTSKDVRRPLIYTNMTQHWFHDPKNWDDHRRIFGQNETTVPADGVLL